MKTRSELKTMNWQDVTTEQLSSHWDGMEDCSGFELARYQNAYAYGDIAGEGIDIRCQYADEVVKVYKENIHSSDIHTKLSDLGWHTNEYDRELLEMQKDDDVVWFYISEHDEVGYMTMGITNEYADICCSIITEYFEQAEKTIQLFGRQVVVSEGNIVDLFQAVAKKYFEYTFDAGDGMRNVYIDTDIIQVYPYNEYHFVYVLKYTNSTDGEHTDYNIKDLPFDEQVEYLKMYNSFLEDKQKLDKMKDTEKVIVNQFAGKKIDKEQIAKDFIQYCESKGAYCHRNELTGLNDTSREIIYCTKFGVVYWYFDNNGDNEMPTMQVIGYPLPSELKVFDSINYLIEECLSAGMYDDIREIAEFLKLSDDEKNKVGLPHEYYYGWLWEDGRLDGKAEYTKLRIDTTQIQKDCEYLKSIYPMIKDGEHIMADGTIFNGYTTEEMIGNAEQFCTYFKESGLSLQEFLAQYDDLSRSDSLWSKCNEFAKYLMNYLGENACDDIANELADLMHSYIISNGGSSYFPKK